MGGNRDTNGNETGNEAVSTHGPLRGIGQNGNEGFGDMETKRADSSEGRFLLSYASQGPETAKRIRETLRGAGISVPDRP